MLNDHRLFFRQFVENFHTTGSLAPSSRWLAQALARYVAGHKPGRKILEVGPGTGAVTRWIVPQLAASDSFDVVELNRSFVEHLRERFERDPFFTPARTQTRILHQAVEDLDPAGGYDAIVSGLPLNNFSGELVGQILSTLSRLLAPGGTLSFFEYVGVRPVKRTLAGRNERARLTTIGQHLYALLKPHEFHRECVLRNFPPAWVHHVRLFSCDAAASGV
ncbi:MAG TPA: methyltransferase [Pirellulales bacterium]|jgi:phospholipid N-methyltransferase